MTPDRLPYFPFYPQDFLGDGKVRLMSPAEVGIYIRLLCHEWLEGPLPDDLTRLARIAGATHAEIEEAWPAVRECFTEDEEGRLVQTRLEEEREKVLAKREQARRAARARWDDADADADGHADADADASSIADATGDANQNHNQKQHKGDDGESGGNATADADGHADASDETSPAVDKVWRHYVRRYGERYSPGRAERLKLSAAGRDGKIRGRLRDGYSPEELCRAIDGCFGDDWHRERDKHDLEYVLRNQSKVEGFLNRAERNGGPPRRRRPLRRAALRASG